MADILEEKLFYINRLILEAATTARQLIRDELQQILDYLAQVGFDPDALEKAGGRIAGLNWQGHTIRAGDRLPPAEVHYLRHVVAQEEWPQGTTFEEYLASISQAIRSPLAEIFTSHFRDREWQLGIIVPSGELRGIADHDWILIEYRLSIGRLITAYQFSGELPRQDVRRHIRWLRSQHRQSV